MSLLQFKPAPMYILDEIDAALDLQHTQHIGQLFRNRFKGSQFIVVSLKEGLFTNANVLFRARFRDGTSIVEVSLGEASSRVSKLILISGPRGGRKSPATRTKRTPHRQWVASGKELRSQPLPGFRFQSDDRGSCQELEKMCMAVGISFVVPLCDILLYRLLIHMDMNTTNAKPTYTPISIGQDNDTFAAIECPSPVSPSPPSSASNVVVCSQPTLEATSEHRTSSHSIWFVAFVSAVCLELRLPIESSLRSSMPGQWFHLATAVLPRVQYPFD